MRNEVIILFCALIVAALVGCESSLRKQPDQPHTIANASYDISLLSAEKSIGTKKVLKNKELKQSLRKEFKSFVLKMTL